MTMNATDGTPILCSLRSADGKGVVRIENRFDTEIDDLWSAFTDPRRLSRWLGEVRGNLGFGGEFRAHFHASGWEGTGHVEVCEPPRRLLVRTQGSDDLEVHSIEAWLSPAGEQTILVVEERGMPVDHLAGYGAGIQIHVEDLAAHLAGRERVPAERWDELLPAYRDLAARLG